MEKTTEKLRVGIWGLGHAGYGMHCSEIDWYPDEIEIVAACEMPRGCHSAAESVRWIRKTIMVEPANKRQVTDIYRDLYLAIRKNVPFPITLEETIGNVKVMDAIKKQNPDFRQKADVFGCETF
jgi:hypothetical protein